MTLSLSAGGRPADVKQALRAQIDAQLGTAPAPEKAAVAAAALSYVDAQLADVADDRTVSVSASLYVTITKL